MAFLAADRDTPEKYAPDAMLHERVATSSKTYYRGQIIAEKVGTTGAPFIGATAGDLTLRVIGRCEQALVTVGSNTKTLKVRSGIFHYANGTSGEAIAAADCGKICYVVDDQTVGISGNSAANAIAGRIYDVDSGGVWVQMGFNAPARGATAGL